MCLQPINVKIKRTKHTYQEKGWTITQKSNSKEAKRHFIPCGKCPACESKKRHDWAVRLYYENLGNQHGYFIMLTYDETQVKWLNKSTGEINIQQKQTIEETDKVTRVVDKRDVQNFIKRLRSDQKYYAKKLGFKNYKIRYFAVSEYGTKYTKRPHYHILIWGTHPSTINRLTTQSKIWKKGIATAKPLDGSIKTFFYITKYLYKQKLINKWAVKPFSLMSKKPYIGQHFEKAGLAYMLENNTTVIEIPNSDRVQRIPRIYADKLPDIKKEIATKSIIKKLDKAQEDRVKLANKKGHKSIFLTELEKKERSHKKHLQEILTLNEIS